MNKAVQSIYRLIVFIIGALLLLLGLVLLVIPGPGILLILLGLLVLSTQFMWAKDFSDAVKRRLNIK